MELRSDTLEAFVVFSETMNFTRAAEQLHISQPALHVKIAKLSEELGLRLYVNDGRALRLTQHGVELARYGREARQQTADFLSQLLGRQEDLPVVLAAGAGSYLYLLGEAIAQFRKRGRAPLKLLTADRRQTLELLNTGTAHLGVTALEKPPAGMRSSLLLSVPSMLVVPVKSPLARKRSLSISDLDRSELIVPAAGRPQRLIIDRVLAEHGIDWTPAIEASGWEVTLHFVTLGLGNAIVNGCCKIPRGLKAIPLKEFPHTDYFLVTKRTLDLAPQQQLLAELIRKFTPRPSQLSHHPQ